MISYGLGVHVLSALTPVLYLHSSSGGTAGWEVMVDAGKTVCCAWLARSTAEALIRINSDNNSQKDTKIRQQVPHMCAHIAGCKDIHAVSLPRR